MLHPKLAHTIKDTQKRLLNERELPTPERLEQWYSTFRERFGPQVLANLDGEVLLKTMHDLRRENRNSLAYWLEFKNDEEFPAIFGSISGGSALKFNVYPNAATGRWMGRGPGNVPIEITIEEAINIARNHRDQLLRGVVLLERLPSDATDEDYAALQHDVDAQLPNVGQIAWGHKYLSLLFPDKLDDYHVASYQRFHLVKILETELPEDRNGRFIVAGRFVRAARELDMPMNHLTTVLNTIHGEPHQYWSVLASDPQSPDESGWVAQYHGGYAAITWPELGDLSGFEHNTESKNRLRERMQSAYPQSTTADLQGVFDFVTDIAPQDVIVALDRSGRKAIGVGKIKGKYFYKPSSAPHRLPVEWLSTEEWQFPDEKGFDGVSKEIRVYANQVEIERHILEPKVADVPPTDVGSHISHSALQDAEPQKINLNLPLDGVQGRIQEILDRKAQVILYGPPGTGKTYWAESTACELAARQVFGRVFADLSADQREQIFGRPNSYVQLCSFHPAYGYEDFLEGYRPQLINELMTFVRQNGIFKQLCELARQNSKRSYYLIIDEINRGDIPRIFGELLTVLEKDKRGKSILLPLSGEAFSVPDNVFVIGTMNTADRSIALLDTALRRRFGFVELLPDTTYLRTATLDGIPLGPWLDELNKRILQFVGRDARNLQIGHAYFLEAGKPLSDFAKFARVIREDIIPLLEEYCYEDYAALRQILGDTLVDEQNQIIRQELFETGREQDLIGALLKLTPELMTLASVTESDQEDLESNGGNDEEAT